MQRAHAQHTTACICLYAFLLPQIPDELDAIPMVDEALASAAYSTVAGGTRTPSRKTRWTTEQIEALIEGVEKYGLSAWRTIVMVSQRACSTQGNCGGPRSADHCA